MSRDRNALLDRVKGDFGADPDAFERLQARKERKLVRRRVGGVGVGLALTAAIMSAFVLTPLSDDDGERSVRSESPVPLVAGPGEFYYERAHGWTPGAGDGVVIETWVGPDGSGRVEATGTGYESLDGIYGPGEFPRPFLPDLSSDPDELLQQLIERGSPQGASPNPIATTSPGRSQETTSLLRTLDDLLDVGFGEYSLLPTQVAVALEAAGSIDDVTTETGVEDLFGRDAARLSWVLDYNIGPGSRKLWYFEPSTGQFMGGLIVNQRTGAIEGAMWVEHAGIASSMKAVPALEASYVPEATGEPDLGPIELPPTP